MKVILLQDVSGLGKALEVKEVKNGYGFNYLLPEGLADFATPGALKNAAAFVSKRRADAAQKGAEKEAVAQALNGKKVVIKSKAEHEKLFGSVGREEIVLALDAMGIKVEKNVLVMEKTFKEVGVFPVQADFGNEVKATFEVAIEAA